MKMCKYLYIVSRLFAIFALRIINGRMERLVKHVQVLCFPNLIKNYIASMRKVVEAYKKTVREIRTVQDRFINSYR